MIKTKFTKENYEQLAELLKNKFITIRKIAKIMNKSCSTICTVIKKHGGRDNFKIPDFSKKEIKNKLSSNMDRYPFFIPLEKAKKISEMLNMGVPKAKIAYSLEIPPKSLDNFLNLGGGKNNFNYQLAFKKRKDRCISFDIQTDLFFPESPIKSDIEEIKTDTPKSIEFEISDEELPPDLKRLHQEKAIPDFMVSIEKNQKELSNKFISNSIDMIINQLNYLKTLINGI